MKILVLPLIESNLDGNIVIQSINSWPEKNQETINKKFIGYLESEILFKDHNIYRLSDTDFYVIYTLPDESGNDILDLYFRKLEHTFQSKMTRKNEVIPTIIDAALDENGVRSRGEESLRGVEE